MNIEYDKKINELSNSSSECSFHNNNSGAICSPKHIVDKMEEYINKKIVVSGNTNNSNITDVNTPNQQKILDTIMTQLNCNSESCVLENADFRRFAHEYNIEEVLDNFFKPEGPSKKFGLLSNFNIDDVLDQFEKKFTHRNFLHIPFQMRDFEKVGTKLATIDLADEFNNGKKTFGVVLNTDWSSGRGVHWFCIFGEDLGDKIIIEYFNSSGRAPLPEIQAWLNKTKHHLEKSLKKEVTINYSTGIKFQNDDHSCGVYCLCYIWLRLENIPSKYISSDNFNDKIMHKARNYLFRNKY